MNEVTYFISKFSSAKDLFLYGLCYWFSIILHERFGGMIFYLPISNHFITWIDGSFYDASGDISDSLPEPPVLWETYAASDPAHAENIRRDCILKTDVMEV